MFPTNSALAGAGFTRIDIQAFLGDHPESDRELASKCLVCGWAALLNLSRKGDAEKLRLLGCSIFGETDFTDAIDKLLHDTNASKLAKDGFARIEIKDAMGGHICDDREMAKKCIIGAWACFTNIRRQGDADKMEEMGKGIFGEGEWEKGVKEALGEKAE